jgi:hypothetical protein
VSHNSRRSPIHLQKHLLQFRLQLYKQDIRPWYLPIILARKDAILGVNRAVTQAGFATGDQGGLPRVLADLVIPELFMAAVTVGFVGAVLALAQVIVLAFVTLEG